VSAPEPAIEGATAAQDAASAWQKVHADPTIQYAPIDLNTKPPEVPGWLQALGKLLRSIFEPIGQALGVSWPVLQWVLLGLLALFVLYAGWRFSETLRLGWKRKDPAAPEPEWRPDPAEALSLLEDADRLAAEGKFDEATYLLLRRSVQQIQAARPDWVRRASTAREIAGIAALPDKARTAFATIAARVERSLFALRQLDAGDWQAARTAYAEFALERLAQ
jgi:hypothetical protein